MNEREKTIRLWFDMWLNQQDMGIDDIFTADVIYTESWSPQYNNRKTVKHWFQDWNTRGTVSYTHLISKSKGTGAKEESMV